LVDPGHLLRRNDADIAQGVPEVLDQSLEAEEPQVAGEAAVDEVEVL